MICWDGGLCRKKKKRSGGVLRDKTGMSSFRLVILLVPSGRLKNGRREARLQPADKNKFTALG